MLKITIFNEENPRVDNAKVDYDDNGDDFCSHDENDIFEFGFGVAVADYDDFY